VNTPPLQLRGIGGVDPRIRCECGCGCEAHVFIDGEPTVDTIARGFLAHHVEYHRHRGAANAGRTPPDFGNPFYWLCQ